MFACPRFTLTVGICTVEVKCHGRFCCVKVTRIHGVRSAPYFTVRERALLDDYPVVDRLAYLVRCLCRLLLKVTGRPAAPSFVAYSLNASWIELKAPLGTRSPELSERVVTIQ